MPKVLTIPTAASLTAGATPQNIKVISDLALRQMQLEDQITRDSEAVARLSAQLYKLKTEDIPTAMQEAGVKAVTLPDGSKVEVEDFVTGNIKEENRAEAFAWLRKNKLGSIIKRQVSLAFGMGEDRQAKELVALLKKKKYVFAQKEDIHTQTLRAFVRERLREGKALPPQIDVTTVPTTTIKRKKS